MPKPQNQFIWALGHANTVTIHPTEPCFANHSFVLLLKELEYCIGKSNELCIQVLEKTGQHLEANDISLSQLLGH